MMFYSLFRFDGASPFHTPDLNCGQKWGAKGAQVAKFMGPAWGPPESCRPQMGPCWPYEPCYQGVLGLQLSMNDWQYTFKLFVGSALYSVWHIEICWRISASSKRVLISPGKGIYPDVLLVEPLGTNYNELWIKIHHIMVFIRKNV